MKRIASLTVFTVLVVLAGCAGDSARLHSQGPQLAAMTPDILRDAEIGVRAQESAVIAASLGVPQISAGLAATKRVHHDEFAAGMASFGRTPKPAP